MYDPLLYVTALNRLVGFAETLPGEDAILAELTEAVTDVFDLVGACVLISMHDDLHDDERLTIAAVSPMVADMERCQAVSGSGPAFDAYRDGAFVDITDIRAKRHRWPEFVDAADRAGIAAIASLPLFNNEIPIGSLDLHAGSPRVWSTSDIAAAGALAALATAQAVNSTALRQTRQLAEQLEHALESRVVIEQAKGMLAASDNIDVERAFERLRQHARKHRTSVRSVAQAVVDLRVQI